MSQALAKEMPREEGHGGSRRNSCGLLVTAAVGGTLVALYAVATPFVTPALRKVCLPFVPATAAQIQNVLKMLENRSGSLVDIGSGDGRILDQSDGQNVIVEEIAVHSLEKMQSFESCYRLTKS